MQLNRWFFNSFGSLTSHNLNAFGNDMVSDRQIFILCRSVTWIFRINRQDSVFLKKY